MNDNQNETDDLSEDEFLAIIMETFEGKED